MDWAGYSQTMIALGDGREILQLVTVNNRVEYAKFRLPEKLPTYGFPWDDGRRQDRAENRLAKAPLKRLRARFGWKSPSASQPRGSPSQFPTTPA